MAEELHNRSNMQYENLIYDTIEMPTGPEILKKGTAYKRGMVLGYITSENKCVLVDKKAVDSSKAVYAVLAQDVDATLGDAVGPVYYAGGFNAKAVIFAADNTSADHKASARQVGIFFK